MRHTHPGEDICPRCTYSSVKVHKAGGIRRRTCRGCHFSFRVAGKRIIEVFLRTDYLVRFRERVRREALQ